MKYVRIVPLPGTWTPLIALQAYLQRKLAEYDANCPPGEEVHDWRRFVLLLWAGGGALDLGGNANPEDPAIHEISYPLQERNPDSFRIDMLDQPSLQHIISGRIHHNLHLRDHRPDTRSKKGKNPRKHGFSEPLSVGVQDLGTARLSRHLDLRNRL